MALAASTTRTLFLTPSNTIANNPPSPQTLRTQSQTSTTRSFSLYNPKLSHHRRPLTVFAVSSSQGKCPFALLYVVSLVDTKITTDALDKIRVFDVNGNAIPLTDLWKDRKAIVAFARHFGDWIVSLNPRVYTDLKLFPISFVILCEIVWISEEQMDAAGVALVLIGPGTIEQAKAFVEQTKFQGEVYADPDHSSYDALGFVSGITTTFTPKAGLKIIQSYMEGYRQDWGLSFQENTVSRGGWQQGGIIVAGPGKTNISYIHKDKEAGDDPPIEDILKACCS
ncbi:hypothetical protein Cgig2_004526 [Carnegiea gigantea]|uniref:Uncharacterized protein n=1 Tax=Carnegiea gigantea TaxID=171969 RepID=A0A9Q1K6U8_9CARY|nr:hypothetical protein Cgig2_004526 [Carnegiea gigantea]